MASIPFPLPFFPSPPSFPFPPFFPLPTFAPPLPCAPLIPLKVGPLYPPRGLGDRCKLPQRGLGWSASRNRFWCILAVATILMIILKINCPNFSRCVWRRHTTSGATDYSRVLSSPSLLASWPHCRHQVWSMGITPQCRSSSRNHIIHIGIRPMTPFAICANYIRTLWL